MEMEPLQRADLSGSWNKLSDRIGFHLKDRNEDNEGGLCWSSWRQLKVSERLKFYEVLKSSEMKFPEDCEAM